MLVARFLSSSSSAVSIARFLRYFLVPVLSTRLLLLLGLELLPLLETF